MPKDKYLTNHQLLKELAKRLPDFTEDEIWTLIGIIQPYQEKVLKKIKELNPEIYGWIKSKHQQLEQQKTDQEIDQLKKSLDQK